MKLSKDDIVYVTVSLLIFFLFSFLLYRDFKRRIGSGDRVEIGTITFKNRVAQRKFSDQVVWEDLDTKVPLYNRDSIRTAELSEAIIELKNGTKIELDQTSMIILNIREGAADINFEYGSISAKQAGGGAESELNIVSGDNKLSLRNSEVKLTQNEGEDLSLVVKQGLATLFSGEGGETTVKENEKAELSGNKIEVKEIPVTLTSPAEGRRLFSDQGVLNVPFEWEAKADTVNFSFEINNTRDFQKNNVVKKTKNRTISVPLAEGSYYWRVVAKDQSGKEAASEIRRISIIRKEPIRFFSPSDNESITYVEKEPYINFLWAADPIAEGYVLDIARDRTFEKIFKSADLLTTNYSMQFPEGEYFARVRTVSGFPDAVQTSATRRFLISRREKLTAPKPLRPSSDEKITVEFLQQNGYIFSWNKSPEVTDTEFWISKNEQFTDIVKNWRGPQNFYLLKESLPPGNYYWRVRGESGENKTDFSAIFRFQVTDIDWIVLLKPYHNKELDATDSLNGIEFIWSDSPVTPPYTFILSSDESMKRTIRTEKSEQASQILKGLDPGKYYWKVLKRNEAGGVVADSRVMNFQINPRIDEPEPIFPSPNKSVDMSEKEGLLLKWESVTHAKSYNLKLYKVENGKKRVVYETKTTSTELELKDMQNLDTGSFIWGVTAEGGRDTDFAKSEEIQSGFTITLPDLPPPKIISPSTQSLD